MTRIILAAEADMGAGFVDVRKEKTDEPKLHYSTKEGGPEAYLERRRVMRDLALHYDKLHALQKVKESTSNEITVAYRFHEGDRFPIFAMWNKTNQGYVCTEGETSSKHIFDQFIPDEWKKTREN